MAIGECSAYSRLLADSKVKFAAWQRVGSHLALTNFHSEDPSDSCILALCHRCYSTLNIVLCVIMIIIITLILVSIGTFKLVTLHCMLLMSFSVILQALSHDVPVKLIKM